MLDWHHTERAMDVSRGKGKKFEVFYNFPKVVQFDSVTYNQKRKTKTSCPFSIQQEGRGKTNPSDSYLRNGNIPEKT